MSSDVKRLRDVSEADVRCLLERFGLGLKIVDGHADIPGSYWGDDEAGLIADHLYARADTPLHSILHEACHWITCTPAKRARVHTDAADNQTEENATCFLQILLAEHLAGFGMARALSDMDAWGYSFRLGNAAAWFAHDANEERVWLERFCLIDRTLNVTFQVRSFS